MQLLIPEIVSLFRYKHKSLSAQRRLALGRSLNGASTTPIGEPTLCHRRRGQVEGHVARGTKLSELHQMECLACTKRSVIVARNVAPSLHEW
jgi:hypothetical protein